MVLLGFSTTFWRIIFLHELIISFLILPYVYIRSLRKIPSFVFRRFAKSKTILLLKLEANPKIFSSYKRGLLPVVPGSDYWIVQQTDLKTRGKFCKKTPFFDHEYTKMKNPSATNS